MNWNQLHERAKQFTGISEEMDKRLMRLANVTWDTIGGDILVDDEGHPAYDKSVPRKEVIEIVCDADYMWMHGGDEEAYAYFLYLRDNNLKHRDKVMKLAFPCSKYGW
jgi:hypothetical protein